MSEAPGHRMIYGAEVGRLAASWIERMDVDRDLREALDPAQLVSGAVPEGA